MHAFCLFSHEPEGSVRSGKPQTACFVIVQDPFTMTLMESYEGRPFENRLLSYDALGRLVREGVGTFQIQYAYDHLGNRLSQTTPEDPQQLFQYNTRNELLQQTLPGYENVIPIESWFNLNPQCDLAT